MGPQRVPVPVCSVLFPLFRWWFVGLFQPTLPGGAPAPVTPTAAVGGDQPPEKLRRMLWSWQLGGGEMSLPHLRL